MKSWKRPVIVAALVLLLVAGVLALNMGVAAQDGTDSGVPGLSGPAFTVGIFMTNASGDNPNASPSGKKVYNGYPFAISGYALSKTSGTLHVWIVSCSQIVVDLGFKVGDIVPIYCAASQIRNINTGDFLEVYGFTARGYLVRGGDSILPAPFSY